MAFACFQADNTFFIMLFHELGYLEGLLYAGETSDLFACSASIDKAILVIIMASMALLLNF